MGQGAYMTVENQKKTAIKLFINNVNCMYDNGQQGSNLQTFNSVTVEAESSLPAKGQQGQYIEDVDSGACAFETATFTLVVVDTSNNSTLGTVAFSEGSSEYSGVSSNVDLIQVYTSNNSGSQSVINVTVI
jgi:hypothetical protein